MSSKDRFNFTYSADSESRLDTVLAEHLNTNLKIILSRSQIKKLIEAGNVFVNDKVIAKAGSLLKPGAGIEIILPSVTPSEKQGYDFKLNVVFEDADIIVIDKPAGLTMHPGAGNPDKTLLNAVINYLGAGASEPYVVHRLDKDTTGLVVLAKNVKTKAALSAQFADRSAGRRYLALAYVTPRGRREIQQAEQGKIETFYGRHPHKRKLMTVLETGRRAITNWKIRERFNHAYLLELKLETGRTHQIRVHLNYLGSPLIGDMTYGNFADLPKELLIAANEFGRQALHAYELTLQHPATNETMVWTSALPEDFKKLIEEFKK